jgi:thiamine biosynthesis lipoprotein
MSSPSALPSHIASVSATDVSGSFRAMAGTVNVRIGFGAPSPRAAIARVESIFRAVESQCTRFDPHSPLMQANAAGEDWQCVPTYCYAALGAAAEAYLMTDGGFDPRVLPALRRLGYDRSLPFDSGEVSLARPTPVEPASPVTSTAWQPRFDSDAGAVSIGPVPVDLGGIGKGLAIRWSADAVSASCESFLIEAGGDCYLAGTGPLGAGWQVGVEDPRGGEMPLAVLNLRDTGCATSSIRIRHWLVDGRRVHHIIDPRTGAPGGDGLLAVTVVAPDAACAEVWSKVLFIAGRHHIADEAARRGLRALWIADDGAVGISASLTPDVIWQRPCP